MVDGGGSVWVVPPVSAPVDWAVVSPGGPPVVLRVAHRVAGREVVVCSTVAAAIWGGEPLWVLRAGGGELERTAAVGASSPEGVDVSEVFTSEVALRDGPVEVTPASGDGGRVLLRWPFEHRPPYWSGEVVDFDAPEWERPAGTCLSCGAPGRIPRCGSCAAAADAAPDPVVPGGPVASVGLGVEQVSGDGVWLVAFEWRGGDAWLHLLVGFGRAHRALDGRRWALRVGATSSVGFTTGGVPAAGGEMLLVRFGAAPAGPWPQFDLSVPGPAGRPLLEVSVVGS